MNSRKMVVAVSGLGILCCVGACGPGVKVDGTAEDTASADKAAFIAGSCKHTCEEVASWNPTMTGGLMCVAPDEYGDGGAWACEGGCAKYRGKYAEKCGGGELDERPSTAVSCAEHTCEEVLGWTPKMVGGLMCVAPDEYGYGGSWTCEGGCAKYQGPYEKNCDGTEDAPAPVAAAGHGAGAPAPGTGLVIDTGAVFNDVLGPGASSCKEMTCADVIQMGPKVIVGSPVLLCVAPSTKHKKDGAWVCSNGCAKRHGTYELLCEGF